MGKFGAVGRGRRNIRCQLSTIAEDLELVLTGDTYGPAAVHASEATASTSLADDLKALVLEQSMPLQPVLGEVAVWRSAPPTGRPTALHSHVHRVQASDNAWDDETSPDHSLVCHSADYSPHTLWPFLGVPPATRAEVPGEPRCAWTGRTSTLAALQRRAMAVDGAPIAGQWPRQQRQRDTGGERKVQVVRMGPRRGRADDDGGAAPWLGVSERAIAKSGARREHGKHSFSVKQVLQRSRQVESRRAAGRESFREKLDAQENSLALGFGVACRV